MASIVPTTSALSIAGRQSGYTRWYWVGELLFTPWGTELPSSNVSRPPLRSLSAHKAQSNHFLAGCRQSTMHYCYVGCIQATLPQYLHEMLWPFTKFLMFHKLLVYLTWISFKRFPIILQSSSSPPQLLRFSTFLLVTLKPGLNFLSPCSAKQIIWIVFVSILLIR